jgi:DNA topoisomerase-1
MVKKRKQEKTKEEKLAEDFFPVDTDDLKSTIEKPEKQIMINAKTKVEKAYKGPQKQPKSKKSKTYKKKPKTSKKIKKTVKPKTIKPYKPSKIKLKSDGYELIITEKPQAATKIAQAFGSSSKKTLRGISYYELSRQGKDIIIAPAVGHLFTLAQTIPGSQFPVFDINWVPNYQVRKADFTKKYYDTILSLAKKAGSITVATDYDVEGEVIGLNIIKFLCGQKDANRMKFSTLTPQELNKAYDSKTSTLNWGQAIAGETRHYLDWFYGINLSRALMNALKSSGRFRIMSIGRVQGPTLNLIVKKEKQIQAFKSQPYWQVFVTAKNDHVLELQYPKDIFNKKELKPFENLKGKTAQAKTEKKQETLAPGTPFNLTTLQTEAYKFHGITPSRTLQAAQSLYLSGLISYPRTSSQKLPESINYQEILKQVGEKYNVTHLIKKQKPIQGKKTDPAHPSIYPTGNFQILSGDEEKIYNLIAKRFLSLFCEDAVIDKKKITVEVDKLKFTANGSEITKKAWMEIYPCKLKEKSIPDLNGKVKITNVKFEEKETQPPKRYSPASIISELEKKNLGTKATRSNILETLYNRGYIKGTSIQATPLGMSLIESLEKHSPIIIDEKLTRSFEDSMEAIREAKKDLKDKEEKIINKAKKTITSISKTLKEHETQIGKELLVAEKQRQEQEREDNKLGFQCPVCKKGTLTIMYSRKTRRSFIACDAYPNCKNTYSLPPNSLIKKTDKTCEHCGFPKLLSIRKGKKPWSFCFNPNCETNKERIEAYKKKQEENKK